MFDLPYSVRCHVYPPKEHDVKIKLTVLQTVILTHSRRLLCVHYRGDRNWSFIFWQRLQPIKRPEFKWLFYAIFYFFWEAAYKLLQVLIFVGLVWPKPETRAHHIYKRRHPVDRCNERFGFVAIRWQSQFPIQQFFRFILIYNDNQSPLLREPFAWLFSECYFLPRQTSQWVYVQSDLTLSTCSNCHNHCSQIGGLSQGVVLPRHGSEPSELSSRTVQFKNHAEWNILELHDIMGNNCFLSAIFIFLSFFDSTWVSSNRMFPTGVGS